MASLTLHENEGDQDTLGPLPGQQGGIPWMTGPPAYGYIPMPQYPPPPPQPDAVTPGYAQSVSYCSSHSGSRSPHSQSGSSKRSDKGADDHRSSGGSSSERSGSSRGKDRKSDRSSAPPSVAPSGMQPRPLDQVPDSIAASRNSFRMAMGNPCEFFVDVM